jgi:hypothetical protein
MKYDLPSQDPLRIAITRRTCRSDVTVTVTCSTIFSLMNNQMHFACLLFVLLHLRIVSDFHDCVTSQNWRSDQRDNIIQATRKINIIADMSTRLLIAFGTEENLKLQGQAYGLAILVRMCARNSTLCEIKIILRKHLLITRASRARLTVNPTYKHKSTYVQRSQVIVRETHNPRVAEYTIAV